MITIFAVTGLIFIILEFFLPGAIMAIGGTIMLLISLTLYYLQSPDVQDFALFALSLGAVVIATIFWIVKRLKKGKILHRNDQEGFLAASFPKEMIGQMAMTSSDLKPAGYIEIEGQVFSALSQLGYIDKGTKVRIIDGQGAYLIVTQEKIHHDSHSTTSTGV